MGDITAFLNNMDWWGLIGLMVSAAEVLVCITIHELSHGLVAYRLGDPTAKNAGRLTLNPIKHIDPVGFVMMLVAKVGWAKAVEVDMRYFKHPKQGMAITALAGPASNFLLAFFALAASSLIYHFSHLGSFAVICLSLLSQISIYSIGLGIFNLIPIPPLDGSKIMFSFLPDKAYLTILKYERYVMILVLLLVMLGTFQGTLSNGILWGLQKICNLVGYPIDALFVTQDISFVLRSLF